MRKSVLAVAASASVFAITFVGAAGLTISANSTDTTDVKNFGSVTITADVSDCDTVSTVTYGYDANGDLDEITLTGDATDCNGESVTVTAGGLTETGTFNAGTTGVITFSPVALLADGANTVQIRIFNP